MAHTLSPVWSRRLALIVSAGLALLVVWLLVRLIWLIAVGPQVESAPVPPVPRITQSAGNGEAFRWNLFGPSRAAPTPVVRTSPARSGLRLLGIMSGPRGYAIIADSQGREEVYRAGDELPDGARLDSIEPWRILLVRNGRTEALELDGNRAGSAETVERPPGDETPAGTAEPSSFSAPAGISVASLHARTGAVDAGALARNIAVMPVAGGGFRVRPGRDARLFAQLGLQVNDIVLAVNGRPLESEDAARALFSDVLQRGEVAITVRREGRDMTLRPDLEQILGSLEEQ